MLYKVTRVTYKVIPIPRVNYKVIHVPRVPYIVNPTLRFTYIVIPIPKVTFTAVTNTVITSSDSINCSRLYSSRNKSQWHKLHAFISRLDICQEIQYPKLLSYRSRLDQCNQKNQYPKLFPYLKPWHHRFHLAGLLGHYLAVLLGPTLFQAVIPGPSLSLTVVLQGTLLSLAEV